MNAGRADVDALAAALAAAGDELAAAIDGLAAEARERMAAIEALAARCADCERALAAAVAADPAAFSKPRSRRVAGIHFGLRRQRVQIDWPEAGEREAVKRIRQELPELAGSLVEQVDRVVPEELRRLPARALRRIGVRVQAGRDAPFVKRVRDGVDGRLDGLRLALGTPGR